MSNWKLKNSRVVPSTNSLLYYYIIGRLFDAYTSLSEGVVTIDGVQGKVKVIEVIEHVVTII